VQRYSESSQYNIYRWYHQCLKGSMVKIGCAYPYYSATMFICENNNY
jgi:hypothetical protein